MTFIAETNTDRLHSSVQRHVICALISLALGGIASFAGAQVATPPEPSTAPTAAVTQDQGIRNIVLVHGAWADGSSWRSVYDNLVRDGFKVSIVQEPETSFQDDVTAVKRILALQDGPSILVAHSYGGAVITEAGTDPSVAGLVYVAAHMPDHTTETRFFRFHCISTSMRAVILSTGLILAEEQTYLSTQ
jgi:pimeloyl-ACP methyl ester carboxylesterase